MPNDARALRPEHERRLQELRTEYAHGLPERIAGLRDALERALSGPEDQARSTRLQELHQLTHRLTGSAAIFGFLAVSEAARALEEALAALLEEKAGARAAHRRRVRRRARELTSAFARSEPRG